MHQNNNDGLLVLIWVNTGLGTLLSEPVLSALAYVGSIVGSAVYIYTTIKKYKK